MDEDLNHVYETLHELDGRLKAIESVIATLTDKCGESGMRRHTGS